MIGIVEYIVGDGICIWQVALAANVKKYAQRKVHTVSYVIHVGLVSHLNPSVRYIYH